MTKKQIKKQGELIIYTSKKGGVELHADTEHETIWATINQIGELFDVQKAAVSKHLKNIFESGELSEKATVSKMETVQIEGNREIKREIEYYNLDAVIAVGYRVNSKQATQFRIWATKTLREYLLKGFTIDSKKLGATSSGFDNLRKAVDFIESRTHGRVKGTVILKLKKELI